VRTVVNNLTVQPRVQAAAPAPIAAPVQVQSPRKESRHDRSNDARAYADRQASAAPQPQPPLPLQPAPVESAPSAPAQAAAAPVQAAVPPPAPPKPVVQQITLDQGTVLPVILTEDLTSKTAQANDVFHATLATDLVSAGVVVVPRGSAVEGRVTDVKEAAHFKGNALLMIELTQLSARGRKITLVTDAYSKTGEGRGKNTLEKSGGGAALGAIIGAIAGGGKGAAIGAVAGGGAGAGVNAVTRGQQAEIRSETRLEFRLQSPITVAVTMGGGRMEYERNADPQLQQR